jgi:tRNA pseudouridine55 synthase
MDKINGWININKPLGCTSSYIVISLKRHFKIEKIGHTGTLDPLASGVLPIAIGEATKLSQYLMDAEKSYSFTIQFGEQRDTADREGKVIATSEYVPTQEECIGAVEKFIGIIEQVPPIYSAIKVNGKRAYDLARQGMEVALESRKITIYDLQLTKYDTELKQAKYIVKCSKGTYIRTLAEDIAKSLQTCGFVIELARLQVGQFRIEKAVDFKYLQNIDSEEFVSLVERVDKVLDGIPVLDINDTIAQKVRFGQKVELDSANQDLVWLKYNGELLAIGSILGGLFHSSRVFNL